MARSRSAWVGDAIAAGLVEAGVAHEFGDEDEVVRVAEEGGAEGVAQGVAGEVVVYACLVGDGTDDAVCAAGGQPGARLRMPPKVKPCR
jgi:hypothetical protein